MREHEKRLELMEGKRDEECDSSRDVECDNVTIEIEKEIRDKENRDSHRPCKGHKAFAV